MEQELVLLISVFVGGLVMGVISMLIINKVSTGSGSPSKLKREMEDYQAQVESHFEETSKKFKDMTDQYQDLYQHLSVGATTLCRPENVAPGLADQSTGSTQALPSSASANNIASATKVSDKASTKDNPKTVDKTVKQKTQKHKTAPATQAKKPANKETDRKAPKK